jgi:hypothetical protein
MMAVIAEQYLERQRKQGILPNGVTICPWEAGPWGPADDYPTVQNSYGDFIVRDGDWVMHGRDDRFYVIRPDKPYTND